MPTGYLMPENDGGAKAPPLWEDNVFILVRDEKTVKVRWTEEQREQGCQKRWRALNDYRLIELSEDVRFIFVWWLHRFSLGISKMTNECLFTYFMSRSAIISPKKRVLKACDLLLSAIQRESKKPALRVNVGKGSCLYTCTRVREMLEYKFLAVLNMVFRFVMSFVDWGMH